MSLEDLRRQYTLGGLHEVELPEDPHDLFSVWMQTALENAPADWVEPYAMTLATSTADGLPSARIVLLRGFGPKGFVFYTNYQSRKGLELAENSQAALVFYWGYLERQVRVTGSVSKVSQDLSEAYFHKRPRGSQIGATISAQSKVISDRTELETAAAELEEKLNGAEVPLPAVWGGYQLLASEIEFWQGRENRLHDRLQYKLCESDWIVRRLSP